ncbi:hypothetical protein CSOJ01_09191 [Colletotrichum sojae]|uniref:Uncharacterized protein n=1 Tax=Colletotrichum sojae TaxID=2175907 RepID=A0A8H6MRV6_9PEZI|nr:hypothetical protein CSOJ01_09191 [Colletotrichum sojae]
MRLPSISATSAFIPAGRGAQKLNFFRGLLLSRDNDATLSRTLARCTRTPTRTLPSSQAVILFGADDPDALSASRLRGPSRISGHRRKANDLNHRKKGPGMTTYTLNMNPYPDLVVGR